MINRNLVVAMVCLSMLGCGTNMKIETVVDKGSIEKLSDIGLIVGAPSDLFTKKLAQEIGARLAQNQVKYLALEVKDEKKKLSLKETEEESPVKKFIASCGKHQILIISLNRLTTMNGAPSAFEATGMILDGEKGQVIWKFESKGDRKFWGGNPIEDFSDALIAQLKTDHLI